MTTTIEPAQDQTGATHGTDMTPLRTRLFPGLAKPGLPGTTRYGQSLSGADMTAEVLPFIGHEMHLDFMEKVVLKLTTHVPKRLWEEATQAAASTPVPEDGKPLIH